MKKRASRCGSFAAFFLILLISAAFLGCGSALAASAPNLKVAAASPWLYEAASFIGGTHADVRALSKFDESGKAVGIARPRSNELIIAFDAEDAARQKIKPTNKKLRLLYHNQTTGEDKVRAAFFDPAMLPFVAQEIMKIFAAADEKNYSYYQRRLAEYQSRIDSTTGVGRHMLADIKMLDLTGAQGAWVRAAITSVVRPPDDVWKSWLSGDSAALRAALDEAAKRGWLLLLDPWTPEIIRKAASAYPNRITLPPPRNGDFFAFVRENFSLIADRVSKDAEKAKKEEAKKTRSKKSGALPLSLTHSPV